MSTKRDWANAPNKRSKTCVTFLSRRPCRKTWEQGYSKNSETFRMRVVLTYKILTFLTVRDFPENNFVLWICENLNLNFYSFPGRRGFVPPPHAFFFHRRGLLPGHETLWAVLDPATVLPTARRNLVRIRRDQIEPAERQGLPGDVPLPQVVHPCRGKVAGYCPV